MSLPLINADCSSEIKLGRKVRKRSHSKRVKTLLTKLHKLIGLKSPKLTGLGFLGKRTIIVEEMDFGIGTPTKNSTTALHYVNHAR